jgi:heme ABC exporter ATP-binding subunit CcmA
MIAVAGLTKVYGARAALRGVALEVPAGTVLTVLGPNGSGKTTLLRVLATLTRPSAGRGTVAGHDLVDGRDRVRELIGLCGHGTHLYDDLTARENLAFAAALAGITPAEDELAAVLARVGLEAHSRARIRDLSSGMRRRVALARAILRRPRVLLLDEPFAGLDRDSAKRLEDYLHGFRAEGGTAVVVTHSLGRALAIADRVAILVGGRLAASEGREALSSEALERLYQAATEAAP